MARICKSLSIEQNLLPFKNEKLLSFLGFMIGSTFARFMAGLKGKRGVLWCRGLEGSRGTVSDDGQRLQVTYSYGGPAEFTGLGMFENSSSSVKE